ncbi:MAG: isoprenylcysteine carboxylmethyltransferase family protein [Phycisphaerales bacterium]
MTASPVEAAPQKPAEQPAITVHHSRWFHLRGFAGGALLLPMGAAIALSKPMIPAGSVLELVVYCLAWVAFASYVWWRLWATLFIGGRKDQVLATQGPYSVTRNPLYVGSFFFGLSATLFFQSLLGVLVVIALMVIYSRTVIKTEERVLRDRFGSTFDEWCARTPRLIPRFSAWDAPKEVVVNTAAFRRELRRLCAALGLPLGAAVVNLLRHDPRWPAFFHLF